MFVKEHLELSVRLLVLIGEEGECSSEVVNNIVFVAGQELLVKINFLTPLHQHEPAQTDRGTLVLI